MNTYLCTDGNADVQIVADSADAAAQKYVDGGTWGESTKTKWIEVRATLLVDGEPDEDSTESVTITIDAEEPECSEDEHVWQSRGVFGHGGGVIISEVCAHCRRYRVTDTWAQGPSGEQGLRSVEYRAADEASREWAESLSTDEA